MGLQTEKQKKSPSPMGFEPTYHIQTSICSLALSGKLTLLDTGLHLRVYNYLLQLIIILISHDQLPSGLARSISW